MRGRLIILCLLLVGASLSLDLSLFRVAQEERSYSDLSRFLNVTAIALALEQANLAMLCFGLCSLPLLLRLGWVAMIALILAQLFTPPSAEIGAALSYTAVVAALSLIASWLLKFAGFVVVAPGDEVQNVANHEPRYRFSLSKLFGLTSIVAITLFVIRRVSLGAAVSLGVTLPCFVLSTVLTTWTMLGTELRFRRFAVTVSVQTLILGALLVFGSHNTAPMWGIYCVAAFGYAALLRQMGIRLFRFCD